VTVLPWGDHFALFATDVNGVVSCAGGDPQNGPMGPWAEVSDSFSGKPGGAVAAVPWSGAFALSAIDNNGTVRTASGDPQNNLTEWTPVPGLTAPAGSAPSMVAAGSGLDLFAADVTGAVSGTAGGVSVMTDFKPDVHGWHFDNDFVNELLGGAITTYGLCGGMAYSALDYYFVGMPIPTHRAGDFPGGSTYPPDGRLHSMIYNRLIDSFKDNFTKWSCIYPDLDAGVGAAIGVIVGDVGGGILGGIFGGLGGAVLGAIAGGVVGGIVGAGGGWIYGELHEAFECPGGGASGMTKQELPHLIKDFLDKGIPAPIGLIYDRSIDNIGQSHQVVAYGYSVAGNQTLVYVYDNRFHDQECVLTIDPVKFGKIVQTFADGKALPKNEGNWEGLLVSDGYSPQSPSYGQDLGVARPQALAFSRKPIHLVPATASFGVGARMRSGTSQPPTGPVPILIVAPKPEQHGQHLTDTYTVQNFGEYPAHFRTLGVEIDSPDVAPLYYDTHTAGDNPLAPGDTYDVRIDVDKFGDTSGLYYLKTEFVTVPTSAEPANRLTFFFPSASVILT
jgi:hypothetical protein